MSVEFTDRGIDSRLEHPQKLAQFIEKKLQALNIQLIELGFVFCTDAYLLEVNQEFLEHDYYTDIITFDWSSDETQIIGESLISIERISENAVEYGVEYEHELHRVVFHGILHLLGYDDHSDEDRQIMRIQEEAWISEYQEFSHR